MAALGDEAMVGEPLFFPGFAFMLFFVVNSLHIALVSLEWYVHLFSPFTCYHVLFTFLLLAQPLFFLLDWLE